MTSAGWHLLEHIVAAISSIVLKDPPSYPTLPPSTPDPKHCSRQQKEIFGVG